MIKFDRDGREWHISYQKDEGFILNVYEVSKWGRFIEHAFLALTDHDQGIKLGRWRTPPFCWIHPWDWTHKVGVCEVNVTWVTLDKEGDEITHTRHLKIMNLGSAWWRFGQWLVNRLDDLGNGRLLFRVPLTPEQVKEHFPDTWERLGFLVENDEEESD